MTHYLTILKEFASKRIGETIDPDWDDRIKGANKIKGRLIAFASRLDGLMKEAVGAAKKGPLPIELVEKLTKEAGELREVLGYIHRDIEQA